MPAQEKITVAIPVKDEEAYIGRCLNALAQQTTRPDLVVTLLNNCTDRSRDICHVAGAILNIQIIECTLTGTDASAGEARRLALWYAENNLAGNGIVLTTDADATPPTDWIAKNLSAIHGGADVVCGMAEMDALDRPLTRRGLHFDNMREVFLLTLLDEIDSIVNPAPADPWPRHTQRSGASIAMRVAMLRQVGGAPRVAWGEDRALIERFLCFDARIRHEPNIVVPVSGRLEGRAAGGMAETIRRRTEKQDDLTDDRIEPAADAYRRSLVKARLRALRDNGGNAEVLANDLLITPLIIRRAMRTLYFGTAWGMIETSSPVLRRRRVAYTRLAPETRHALFLTKWLRNAVKLPALTCAEPGIEASAG